MTITQLEYVVAVADHGSFAEAAAHRFVTQPTLSIQIAKLEEEIGIVLFDRSRRPAIATDAGRAVIEQARVVIREASRIAEIIAEHSGSVGGELRIGIIPTVSPYLLPRFATAFTRAYPAVQLVVEEMVSERLLAALRNDSIDVGVMVAPASLGTLTARPLYREEFLLYLSPNHRMCGLRAVDITTLDTSDMWLLAEGHCFRDQIETLCGERGTERNGERPTDGATPASSGSGQRSASLRFQSGSLETIRKIVDQQHGYTMLPELAVAELPTEQQANVRRFRGERPVREIALVTHRNFLKRRLVEALADAIVGSIPAAMRHHRRREEVVPWEGR